jgi:transposase
LTSGRRSSSRSRRASPRPLSARRFGVDRATLKRYCERPDERGTLEPRKSPGQETQAGCEKARKLLLEDLRERPWATHSQRAEFLFATCGVSVSEASVCRTLKQLSQSRNRQGQAHPEGDRCQGSKGSLIEAMGRALGAVSSEDVRGFFAHCGYRVPRRSDCERHCEIAYVWC